MSTLKIKRENGKIFCPLADSWHIETPEEKVRQEYIKILVEDYGYSLDQMAQEIKVNNSQRGQGKARPLPRPHPGICAVAFHSSRASAAACPPAAPWKASPHSGCRTSPSAQSRVLERSPAPPNMLSHPLFGFYSTGFSYPTTRRAPLFRIIFAVPLQSRLCGREKFRC